ncbi:hypothetical protein EDD85DRAFT_1026461 [Armillaria nabsnona]|nr:hypothetical protein EDD85DRAFT_1026461 [Armillaria nabsnona]
MGADGIHGDLVGADGATFTGVNLQTESESEASIAVTLSQRIVLLRLGDNRTPHEFCSVETEALRDDISKTLIYNWKTGEHAHLDDVGDSQHNHCLQVVFTPPIILVLLARSITLYTSAFTCIATSTFS